MQLPAAHFLPQLVQLTEQPLYLVGGTVRDLLLGVRAMRDVDLLMPSGSQETARAFAERIKGSFFFLDKERGITRVMASDGGVACQFDFTDLEGKDLEADLSRRDFTINAMALDLRQFLVAGDLGGVIDLFHGREDLQRAVIRAVHSRVLDEDPLRLLRAVRFSATLGFSIDQTTREAITSRAARIAEPSPERVRDELFIILGLRGADRSLLLMEELGLLSPLIPELDPLRGFAPGRYHVHDVLVHSITTVGCLDAVLADLPRLAPAHAGVLRGHFEEQLEQGITRVAALRFSCLLHDIAKYETFTETEGRIRFHGHDTLGGERVLPLCRRLRLSRAAERLVTNVIRQHMRLFNLSAGGGPGRNAMYRYCRDLGSDLPESLLLAQADARATSLIMPREKFADTEDAMTRVLDYYYARFLRTEREPLVNGQDLIDLRLSPGPKFREILDEVRSMQAAGTLQDRSEALAYLKTRIGTL